MNSSVKKEEHLGAFEVTVFQSKVTKAGLQEKLGTGGFNFDRQEQFEPNTKEVIICWSNLKKQLMKLKVMLKFFLELTLLMLQVTHKSHLIM